ncbi:MAG: hypothetical protein ACRDWE_12665 [Acidimicrobiales bacterium]
MGLLDKVKSQAATATAVARDAAKDAAQKGQAKLDGIQAKRAADAMLRDLGAAVYAQHTGRGGSESDSDVERLVASLRAFEEEHGPVDVGAKVADEAVGADGGDGGDN